MSSNNRTQEVEHKSIASAQVPKDKVERVVFGKKEGREEKKVKERSMEVLEARPVKIEDNFRSPYRMINGISKVKGFYRDEDNKFWFKVVGSEGV